MGRPILLLRLEGPLQAWGGRARWDVRDTRTEPTKSGIVGLLGCALGYSKGDTRLLELDAGLRFGVRVEAQGTLLEDYQTITEFLPTAGGGYKYSGGTAASLAGLRNSADARPATIISPRFYLEDAAFLVGLEGAAELLEKCAAALKRPVWPLFLGRKACAPSRPIFEEMTDKYDDLEQALQSHPFYWSGYEMGLHPRAKESKRVAYVETPDGSLLRQDAMRLNASRHYDFVALRRITVTPRKEKEDDNGSSANLVTEG